jgi:hypothetical protein
MIHTDIMNGYTKVFSFAQQKVHSRACWTRRASQTSTHKELPRYPEHVEIVMGGRKGPLDFAFLTSYQVM